MSSRGLVALDHEGSPRIAVLASESTVEVADLAPLAPRPTGPDDTEPPMMDTFSAPPAVVRAGAPSSTFAWSGHDPGHPRALSYQYRFGNRPHGTASITWNGPSVTLAQSWPAFYGSLPYDSCFQVRPVDWAGNIGAWTAPSCLYGDADPPQVGWVTGWQPIQPRTSRTPVLVRYTAADDDKVASYDVLARVAPAGRAWGPWTAFVQRTTATSVRHTWPAGSNVCFLVRARDRAGNVGQTNLTYDSRCTTVPYDDRGLVRGGGAKPGRAAWAQNGTITTLTGSASLTGPRTPVRTVWVSMRSRGGYCPRLWIGGRQIAAWRCNWYPIAGRPGFRYELPRTVTGRATVRAGRNDRIQVDAVALAR
ncbi:MAG: hypothetical protein J7518_11155 [Nocardioidaceae bacterium]|nr:hypothetical protein [Nocardioidaceae bacterium]